MLGQPNLNMTSTARKRGPLWAQRQRRQHRRAGGAGRHHRNDGSGGGPPIRRFGAACAANSASNRRRAPHQGRVTDAGRCQRLYPAERTRQYHPRYRRLLHLSREQSSATSRSSSACAGAISAAPWRRRSSASPEREAAERLSHRLGPASSRSCSRPRRVWRSSCRSVC